MRIVSLTKEAKDNILEDLLKRSPNNYDQYQETVNEILNEVKTKGDEAVFAYTEKFDHAKLTADTLYVTEDEIKEAYEKVDEELIEVMKKSIANIRAFHEKQVKNSWFTTREDGVILGQRVTALDSVGVYVPGGKAAYPSSVLMNIIPAHVAGVRRIVTVTPPGADGKVNPATLVAANLAGATEVCKVGGAQAIAALAYGTESIPKVDNIAGPSEIMILADETANPRYVAADLLSQAEHDELASAILVTTSKELAEKVSAQVDDFKSRLSRKEIISKSIDNYGYILLADTMEDAIETVNDIASEHLEILTANPFDTMTRVKNAGAIFLGEYSSEPLGDYFAGPNHVLPTNGTAKFFSPLSVDDFIKKSSVISYSEEALREAHEDIIKFAKAEHLTAHANSIAVRFDKEVMSEED